MFKVGDKVRRTRYSNDAQHRVTRVWYRMPEGSEWVVEAISPTGWLTVKDYPFPAGCNPAYFEVIPEAPASRANDPATSKGKRKVNKYEQAVLDQLLYNIAYGGTGKELAERTGHPLNCITPRFAPLRRKGWIKAKEELGPSGRSDDWYIVKRDKQIVWVLA